MAGIRILPTVRILFRKRQNYSTIKKTKKNIIKTTPERTSLENEQKFYYLKI